MQSYWKIVGLGMLLTASAGMGVAQPEGAGGEAGEAATDSAAGTYETLEDGSLLIEGRIKVLGKGTKEKPYVVDWGVLTSAMRIYEPRKNKTEMPAWAEVFEGKRVRLTGYLLLPMTGTGSDELLVMQNQWDGCCIGVPPTPYDAVEVRLTESLDTSRGAPGFGSIEGTFKTDPYIVSGWLLGLYLLEDAQMVRRTGGDGS
ncbi:MAG: hypothetical protein DHS20C14_08350 [Phycisphaeraceae bacterium]|nr:MAG: hypothetical protein DHS20C14_08350 [Phycisphaeraceae bacterium]